MARAKIRRHLGAPAAGRPQMDEDGLLTRVRASQLETAMDALEIEEEAIILGQPFASVLLYDPLMPGDVITITNVSAAGTATYTFPIAPGDIAITVVRRIASALSGQMPGLQISAEQTTAPGYAQLAVKSLIGTFSFAATVTNANGGPAATNVIVAANGSVYPAPAYVVDDGNGVAANAITAYGLLPILEALEDQVLSASHNLSFSNVGSNAIGGATFDRKELVRRDGLLAQYRRDLGVMLSLGAASL